MRVHRGHLHHRGAPAVPCVREVTMLRMPRLLRARLARLHCLRELLHATSVSVCRIIFFRSPKSRLILTLPKALESSACLGRTSRVQIVPAFRLVPYLCWLPNGLQTIHFTATYFIDLTTGFFNPFPSHGSYYACPIGTYADTLGSTACSACPVGTYTATQSGATACSNCLLSLYHGAASCTTGILSNCSVD